MPKKLVVFADGTGNAFTTQASNVWRIYQALDQSDPEQVAFYIKGVGTSGFAPFATIDAATGIGVPSNVRKLYRFLCWNWEEGAEIYVFGFSRGAFTARTLIGLIDSIGLVPSEIDGQAVSRAEMHRNSMTAWRAYRQTSSRTRPLVWLARKIRDASLTVPQRFRNARRAWDAHGRRKSLAGEVVSFKERFLEALRDFRDDYVVLRERTISQKRHNVGIRFAGLFDTVEAYGVPIEELRSVIDRLIWPMSFGNHILSPKVQLACHALSLDDERTTFHPLRFDQTAVAPGRIKEVWFAGVHSDVGGGYPDASLAYVPLVWMAEEAEATGLRFAGNALNDFRSVASSLGPTHDSRAGRGVFYRYHPRPILENASSGGPPVVHHSVAEKMVHGTEKYAPVNLPDTALILLPDRTTAQLKGFRRADWAAAMPVKGIADEERRRMALFLTAARSLRTLNEHFVELTRDTIWWRRAAYFGLLLSIILAVSLPWTAETIAGWVRANVDDGSAKAGVLPSGLGNWLSGVENGVAALLSSIFKALGDLLPSYLGEWVSTLVAQPMVSITVLAVVALLYKANNRLRDLIADRARCIWFYNPNSGGPSRLPILSRIARFMRTSRVVRAVRGLGPFAMGAVFVLALALTVLVTTSRLTVTYRFGKGDHLGDSALCKSTSTPLARVADKAITVGRTFSTKDPCWATGLEVEKGRIYTIWIKMDENEPFLDRSIMTDVAGFTRAPGMLWGTSLIRRWWSADWFQPIARIGASGNVEWPLDALDGAHAVGAVNGPSDGQGLLDLLLHPSRICSELPDDRLKEAREARRQQTTLRRNFISQFVAAETGELFLAVNDAIVALPFVESTLCFYENNTGRATVTVREVPVPEPETVQTPVVRQPQKK